MKRVILVGLVVMAVAGSCSNVESPKAAAKTENIKAVVVTGGHGFDKEPFFAIFDGFGDISYVEAVQQNDSEIFEDISGWDYDVIVLYNMSQEISAKRQENFLKLLDKGVGLVALHHSIGAFQNWPEYRKIIGARFYLRPLEEYGVIHGKSGYKHDIDMAVHVEDSRHPITRGVSDFSIHDEVYDKCVFEEDNHLLLSTEHPNSDKSVGHVRKWKNARVCYIQLGHDAKAYANPNYQRLIGQAIRWSVGRLN